MTFKCTICNQEFKYEGHYKRHLNKKIHCKAPKIINDTIYKAIVSKKNCIHCQDDNLTDYRETDYWIDKDNTKSICCMTCYERYES